MRLGKIENEGCPGPFGQPRNADGAVPVWRPIHYLGSKLRLIEPILALVADLDPTAGTVCDLFAGSGTVSVALSRSRKVVAADIQEYSRVICAALLNPARLEPTANGDLWQAIERHRRRLKRCLEPVLEFEQRAMTSAATEPTLLCDLAERGSLLNAPVGNDGLAAALRETTARIGEQSPALMATRYFGGVYFSYGQTLYIDSVLAAIDDLPSKVRTTCLAALLSAASHLVNSVGKQFAQPMRPRRHDGTIKRHLIGQMCRDRLRDARATFASWLSKYSVLPTGGPHRVLRGDYRAVLARLEDVSVIYADPPYTRDHYSRFYHVLETLCLRDSPEVSTTLLTGNGAASRGVYRTDRHQSPFCIKSQAARAFSELFAGCKRLDVPLLLSYSPFIKEGHPRLMTVDAVVKLAGEHYRQVAVVPAGRIAHSKLNKSELHLDVANHAEVFITCKN